ncbi:TIGR01244 family sulfur transferase [Novosphingobium sp. RD2P27]|uniref:TIGR01244 family sulfur transferase n=1 Tax=Novosphingobium kalidii TaxID=3230299 RepID=A0ABV2CZQ5_9SPHN
MFRQLTDSVYASPQIDIAAVAKARELGITLIVNNRPEGESDDQVPGSDIAAAANAVGIEYVAIPVSHAGFAQNQVAAMADALDRATGPVLAYCRSGTRSTLLWALARAKAGEDPARLAEQAAAAGYDVSAVRQVMDMLASERG